MKAILVPVDFSATSVHAARYAQQVARQIGAKLILVHAYMPPPSFPMVEGMLYTEESLRNLMKEKLSYRKQLNHPNLISFSHSL